MIDTAGIRRRGKVFEAVEKFSVVKTLQSISDCNVVILLLDAASEIADQDAHIAGFVLESGRALVVAVNKWDGLDDYQRDRIKREIDRKLHFLRWARVHHISALKRSGLGALMRSVVEAHKAAFAKLPTPKLTRALIAAVARQQPARSGNTRPEAALCAPGWPEPADHRDPRQFTGARVGRIPPLPRIAVPRTVRTDRHAVARRVPYEQKPVRGLTPSGGKGLPFALH